MAEYGEPLYDNDVRIDDLYTAIDTFFNKPSMTKIKDERAFSIYMCKIQCMLMNEHRYLIAFVNIDSNPTNTSVRLNELGWISFLTQTITDNHNIPFHNYQARNGGLLNSIITRIRMDDKCSTYSCDDYPITVTLSNKKSGNSAYQDKGTIVAALETYQTVITLN